MPPPPSATESIKDSVDEITSAVAKKLNLGSTTTNGTKNATNGSTNGTNGHVKPEISLHPLDPLTADEITAASAALRAAYPADSPIHFKAVTLEEPAKAALVAFLDAEHKGSPLPIVP